MILFYCMIHDIQNKTFNDTITEDRKKENGILLLWNSFYTTHEVLEYYLITDGAS